MGFPIAMGATSGKSSDPSCAPSDDAVLPGVEVTRISSRADVTGETLADQRSLARASAQGMRGSLVALDGQDKRYSLANARMSIKARMSNLPSMSRRKLLGDIKVTAEQRGGNPLTIEQRLQNFGLRMKIMEGDGNCQFRSLAFNLFGDQGHHAATRKAVVGQMKKHSDFFSMFFETEIEFEKYLRDMSRARTWGDELTLRAAVEAYGCEAHVVTSEPANWYLVYQPDNPGADIDESVAACPKGCPLPPAGKHVFLSYISPIHYNAIVMGKERE